MKRATKTIQIKIAEDIKNKADNLFESLGLDTNTAIRIFLNISIKSGGFPFEIKTVSNSVSYAMNDVLTDNNLSK